MWAMKNNLLHMHLHGGIRVSAYSGFPLITEKMPGPELSGISGGHCSLEFSTQ